MFAVSVEHMPHDELFPVIDVVVSQAGAGISFMGMKYRIYHLATPILRD